MDVINNVDCNKILVEFLRVNTWVKKWFDIDYSEYTLKQSGYEHLPLDKKIKYLSLLDKTKKQVTVCEDVSEHYNYWRDVFNPNKNDCCNLGDTQNFFENKSQKICVKEINSVNCGRNMVEQIDITRLEFNEGQIEGLPKNPRKEGGEKAVADCMKSLQEDPEMLEYRPLLVYPHGEKYVVLGGNLRLEACMRLGYEKVFCDSCEGMSIQKLKEIVLKDNTQFGRWDMDELANNWDDMPLEDLGVSGAPEDGTDYNAEDADGSKELDTSEYDEQMQIVFRFDETEGEYMRGVLAGKDVKSEIIRRLNDE